MSAETQRIRDSIQQSCVEWGIRDSESFLQQALDYVNQQEDHHEAWKELAPLSGAARDAALLALRGEIEDAKEKIEDRDGLWDYEDRLGSGFPPFYCGKDGKVRTVKTFWHVPVNQLDPWSRFTFSKERSVKAFISHNFSNLHSVTGVLLEGVLAWHVENRDMTCLSCELAGYLRWNGGGSIHSAWADLVCIQCQAAYEVKTKETTEKILKSAVTFNSIPGGSFRTYCANKVSGKHYLIMVNRLPQSALGKESTHHTVFAWEIDCVLPVLCPLSFNNEDENGIVLRSKIRVKPNTRQTWFTFDPLEESVASLAYESFDGYFGSGAAVDHIKIENQPVVHPKSKTWKKNERIVSTAIGGGSVQIKRRSHG